MPDLALALSEIARVCAPGARFAASTFAQPEGEGGVRRWLRARLGFHVVPVDRLQRSLQAAGFNAEPPDMAGPVFAYVRATRLG
jgi:ubiquinone/menaquinone biosynthesis C-methylase UbiE